MSLYVFFLVWFSLLITEDLLKQSLLISLQRHLSLTPAHKHISSLGPDQVSWISLNPNQHCRTFIFISANLDNVKINVVKYFFSRYYSAVSEAY